MSLDCWSYHWQALSTAKGSHQIFAMSSKLIWSEDDLWPQDAYKIKSICCVSVCLCLCLSVSVFMYVFVSVSVFSMCVFVCVCVCVCVCVYVCVCLCVYV